MDQDPLCASCRSKLVRLNRHYTIDGLRVHALYQYEENVERFLYQLKEHKDITLSSLFIHPFQAQLKQHYRNHTCVYAPSSVEKTQERGFFALEACFEGLKLDKQHYFSKDNIDQKHQSLNQRSNIAQAIHYIGPSSLYDHKMVLLDDVMTTGATIQAMHELIKPRISTISALVIAIHPKLIE
jgi:predicted amidophosphoribosyltransferase